MVNKYRGEIEVELGGKHSRLCLTLGALAELEAAFEADDISKLVERFESGRFSANDLIRIIGSGLRGAGEDFSNDEVAQLPVPGGVGGYLRIVAQLLAATFEAESNADAPDHRVDEARAGGEVSNANPL